MLRAIDNPLSSMLYHIIPYDEVLNVENDCRDKIKSKVKGDKMQGFLSTYTNKVDAKGRVSVPSSFRAALLHKGCDHFIAFPSFKNEVIEAYAPEKMTHIMESVETLDMFSDQQDDFKTLLFAEARTLTFDNDGRLVLPEYLRAHAGIKDEAVFVGQGSGFQIWSPKKYEEHKAEVFARLKKQKPVLRGSNES